MCGILVHLAFLLRHINIKATILGVVVCLVYAPKCMFNVIPSVFSPTSNDAVLTNR